MAPLAHVLEFALTFRHNLPDFTCEQTAISTCEQTTVSTCKQKLGSKGPAMQSLVTYLNGQEHYSNVMIDGKPVPANRVADLTKAYLSSRGEFGNLVNLFTPPIVVEFKFRQQTTFQSQMVLVYEFHLPARKNAFWDDLRGPQRECEA